jgi:hypothetical protein
LPSGSRRPKWAKTDQNPGDIRFTLPNKYGMMLSSAAGPKTPAQSIKGAYYAI